MSEAAKHTPTPWQIDEVRTQCGRAFRIGAGEMLSAGKGCCIIYDDYPGNPDNERSANAAFIIRAVNSHDDMLAALKRISDMCPATQEMSVAHMMADEADAAIARAESTLPADRKE